ncbi:LXG domain-containing protein [Rossellomorea marisflavi]|uniref:LXG domain-containing protein n=1 Tax=Rossellomorea marisflavi TaxID=189381 RepID=UPI002853082A|nr:LXG domain-containing protein [Rossellomorea marisflavi]MDR4938255.1 LXG domain-containing protein [Rossellomorea marisflavi]
MKILDVDGFQKGITEIEETLSSQKKQADQMANAIQGVTDLEEAFKGKGGNAIRDFYRSKHLPLLEQYQTFLSDYQTVIKQMNDALQNLEPAPDGFMNEAFLENELEAGLRLAKQTTEQLTSEANNTIGSVSDIVTLPKIEDETCVQYVAKAERGIDQSIEKLYEFDHAQTASLSSLQGQVDALEKQIMQLHPAFQKLHAKPVLSIYGGQKGMPQQLSFSNVGENVNGLINDSGNLGALLEKTKNVLNSKKIQMIMEKTYQIVASLPVWGISRQGVYTWFEKLVLNENAKVSSKDGDRQHGENKPKYTGTNQVENMSTADESNGSEVTIVDNQIQNPNDVQVTKKVQVFDEIEGEIDGFYYVYSNGQIIWEHITRSDQVFYKEVDEVPESRVGGARELDSLLDETPLEFLEWINPKGFAMKMGRKGVRFVTKSFVKRVSKKKVKKDKVKDTKKVEGVSKGTDDVGKGASVADDIFKQGKKVVDKFNIEDAYVKPKHLSTTKGNGAKFLGDSKGAAEQILKDSMKNGKVQSITDNGLTKMGKQSYSVTIDAGKTIGTRGENLIKVVLSEDGGMLSAYPIK